MYDQVWPWAFTIFKFKNVVTCYYRFNFRLVEISETVFPFFFRVRIYCYVLIGGSSSSNHISYYSLTTIEISLHLQWEVFLVLSFYVVMTSVSYFFGFFVGFGCLHTSVFKIRFSLIFRYYLYFWDEP